MQSFPFVLQQFVQLAFCFPMGIILLDDPIVIIGTFYLILVILFHLTSGGLIGMLLALFEQQGIEIQQFCMILDDFVKNGITH